MGQDHRAEVRHHHVGEDLRVGMPFYHQKGQEDGGKRGSKRQIDRTTNTSSCVLLGELETISLWGKHQKKDQILLTHFRDLIQLAGGLSNQKSMVLKKQTWQHK